MDYVGSEEAKALKALGISRKNLKKASEKRHEIAFGQIEFVKDRLDLMECFQELSENYLNFISIKKDFLKIFWMNLSL